MQFLGPLLLLVHRNIINIYNARITSKRTGEIYIDIIVLKSLIKYVNFPIPNFSLRILPGKLNATKIEMLVFRGVNFDYSVISHYALS